LLDTVALLFVALCVIAVQLAAFKACEEKHHNTPMGMRADRDRRILGLL
jgi:hypothetical protein